MDTQRIKWLLMFGIAFLTIFVPVAYGDYKIVWSTIDGGGGQSSGGQYTVTGTIAQPDAGYSASGNYELLGGFWPGGPLCMVELADLALFASYWLDEGFNLPADLNGDEVIDLYDFGLLAHHWLGSCPYNWPLR